MANSSHETEVSGQDGEIVDLVPGLVNHATPVSSLPDKKDEAADVGVVTPLAGDLASLSGGESSNLSTVTDTLSSSTEATEDYGRMSEETMEKLPNISTTSFTTSPSQHQPLYQPQHQPHEHASNSYFVSQSAHQPSFRRSMRTANVASPSSGSLHTLAEQDGQEGGPQEEPALTDSTGTVKRSLSTRSRASPQNPRRHSKSASTSHSVASLRRHVNSEHPVYPDQSFSSLSAQHYHHSRPPPILRSKSSHPTQNLLYNDPTNMSKQPGDKLSLPQFARTADNTPMSSPGLFSPAPIRPSESIESDPQRAGSPQLHHLQTPKETHAAEIEHDLYTGNKVINTYEVVKELGRGEQGKVKLGRDLVSGMLVAIKIVPRFSKQRRRLGKLGLTGEPQDQTKKEVAILKKARHPNVVSLLEVIDDPSKNKVYLVLEFVDYGEIIWRKRGVPAITKINNSRFELDSLGVILTLEPSDQDSWTVRSAAMKHDGLQRSRANMPHIVSAVSHWNLESDADEDFGMLERTYSQAPSIARSIAHSESGHPQRSISQDDYVTSGSPQQGPGLHSHHDDFSYKAERKYSVATAMSHMSSEYDAEDREADEQKDFVPTLTLDEARGAFRDTLLGLEFLHAVGIIHRDIKPANLLVASDGSIKISDFGVSYLGRPLTEADVKKDAVPENQAESLDDERELARNVGTPGFWAPELVYEDASIWTDGKIPKITAAIDLWALGITLYTMIYGRLPWYASETMGLHAAQCTTPVKCPRSRLVPVDTTNPNWVTKSNDNVSPGKRFDYDLRYEAVPDSVRELIQKLLIKHPAERMTITQAKSHPWVLEGLENRKKFLEPPAVVQNDQTVIVPNEKEISVAVVKLTLVDNIGQNLGKASKWFYNSLKGAVTSRKRGSSLATNGSTSSESINNSLTGSTTSTIGKNDRGRDPRRTSLRGDEVVPALHRSRDTTIEHPLAQSQTASPDSTEMPDYFADTTSISSARDPSGERNALDVRPKLPDRAISGVSTADSIKTIRASQVNPLPHLDSVNVSEVVRPASGSFQPRIEGLWEGSRRAQSPLASKDARLSNLARSRSVSRKPSGSENRSAPSLGVSTEYARGSIETPEALRVLNQRLEQAQEVTSPRFAGNAYHKPTTSSDSAFLQAQEINQRRHILEVKEESDQATINVPSDRSTSSVLECPPSPDDLTFDAKQRSQQAKQPRSHFDLGDSSSIQPPISTTGSSMEDLGNSSVTQSASNPSFIATSGASSPPEDLFLSAEYREQYHKNLHQSENAPDFMRTADTITEHERPKNINPTVISTDDRVHFSEDDGDDEQDSNDDDDDEPVLMMGGSSRRF